MSDFSTQLQLLSPKDGDVLVVTTEHQLSFDEWERLRDDFKRWLAGRRIDVYMMATDTATNILLASGDEATRLRALMTQLEEMTAAL